MPASLNINSYPLQLYEIVENVLSTHKKATITASDIKAADKIRNQVYGLRRALIRSTEHPLKDQAAKITTEQVENVLYIKHIDADVDPGLIAAAKALENE